MEHITEEELAKLTPKAVVAFAARCAERVWPLFDNSDASEVDKQRIRTAIDVAISFAEGNASIVHADVTSAAVYAIEIAGQAADSAAAAAAAAAAAPATNADSDSDAAAAGIRVAQAIRAYRSFVIAIVRADSTDGDSVVAVAAARSDYNYLLVSKGPIEFSQMGPLWPLKSPWKIPSMFWGGNSQPDLSDKSLSFVMDPGGASSELVEDFYLALSAYYRSLGGSGIQFAEDEIRFMEGELV